MRSIFRRKIKEPSKNTKKLKLIMLCRHYYHAIPKQENCLCAHHKKAASINVKKTVDFNVFSKYNI